MQVSLCACPKAAPAASRFLPFSAHDRSQDVARQHRSSYRTVLVTRRRQTIDAERYRTMAHAHGAVARRRRARSLVARRLSDGIKRALVPVRVDRHVLGLASGTAPYEYSTVRGLPRTVWAPSNAARKGGPMTQDHFRQGLEHADVTPRTSAVRSQWHLTKLRAQHVELCQ